ncbi:MAG: M23 family metallopeptidase [Oscillibacter sp.]|nr:M23 family metallopeptidase [Oscillibacter sp.]
MSKRWDAIRGSAGFYITMAVCLLVIGVSSYYLLFDRKDPAPAEEPARPPVDTYVAAPAPEITEPKEPPVVETISPAQVETPAPVMPEIEIDDTPVVAEAPLQIVTPLDGEVVTAFSMDQLVYNPTLQDWRTHDGVDISAAEGTAVLAACAGTVLAVEEDAMMGTTVILEHDGGYQTTYANLQEQPGVGAGEAVSAGQILGAVGCTAAAEAAQEPHLHFSVTKDGENMDPNEFLRSVS